MPDLRCIVLKISCLHSAQSDIADFESARRELRLNGVILKHRVRADLNAAAEEAGGLTDQIIDRTSAELRSIARGADVVLLTGARLAPVAVPAARHLDVPLLRGDEALAEEATRSGGRIIVLATTGSVVAAHRRQFEAAAIAGAAAVEMRLVPGAERLWLEGQEADCFRLVADAVDAAAEEGAAVVALAEISMLGAARLSKSRPLTSPVAGLRAAVAAASPVARRTPS